MTSSPGGRARASRPTSSSTPATPEALSLAPGTTGLRAWSSTSASAIPSTAAGTRRSPMRGRCQRDLGQQGQRGAPAAALRRAVARLAEARVPHQPGARGVVVRDEHERALHGRRGGQAADDVHTLRAWEQPAQPLAAPGVLELERGERRRGHEPAPLERRDRPGGEVRALRVREGALVAVRLEPHVGRALLAQAARDPLGRAPLAGRGRAALDRGQRLDVGCQARCQSTGPAVSTWLPSGRPRTPCTSRAQATSRSRSMPVW